MKLLLKGAFRAAEEPPHKDHGWADARFFFSPLCKEVTLGWGGVCLYPRKVCVKVLVKARQDGSRLVHSYVGWSQALLKIKSSGKYDACDIYRHS